MTKFEHPAVTDGALSDQLSREDVDDPIPAPTVTYAQHLAILRESIAAMDAGEPDLSLDDVLAAMDTELHAIDSAGRG